MRRALLLCVLVAGCRDVPLDDAEPPAGCTTRTYAIDAIQLPATANERQRLSFDLDGDRASDDAFGEMIAAVLSINPDLSDWSAAASARLAGGEASWQLEVAECSAGPRPYAMSDVPLGVLADPLGTFAPIALAPPFGTAYAATFTADGAQMRGQLGFAIAMPEERAALLAPFAAYLTGELAAGTSPYAARCDANHDGVCSVDELLASCDAEINGSCTNLATIMTEPDVTIDGEAGLSFGLGFHAVAAPD